MIFFLIFLSCILTVCNLLRNTFVLPVMRTRHRTIFPFFPCNRVTQNLCKEGGFAAAQFLTLYKFQSNLQPNYSSASWWIIRSTALNSFYFLLTFRNKGLWYLCKQLALIFPIESADVNRMLLQGIREILLSLSQTWLYHMCLFIPGMVV